MKVHKMIDELKKMPKDADILLFTQYNQPDEDVHEVIGIRLLEPDPEDGDLVRILYKE